MAATLRTDPPKATLFHRAWYRWCLAVGSFFSLTMSPLLVLHTRVKNTAETMRLWMRPWARFISAGAGIRVVPVQRAPLPDGPVVFVANHVNSLDILSVMLGLPRPFLYVARHEIREWPIVGWVLASTPCHFIRRDDPRQAVRDLQRIAGCIRDGDSVVLFPEGGRSHRHEMEPFMKGPFVLAIEAGVPVVPVALVGNAGVFSIETKTARPGETRVILGEPIPTEGLSRRDANDLLAQTRTAIEAELAAVR